MALQDDRSGIEVGDRFYTWPSDFRIGDPVLVTEITGMDWQEYAVLLDDDSSGDFRKLAGLIAVAIWQGNPNWSRERARRFVEQLDLITTVNSIVRPESADDAEGDALPPASEAGPSDTGSDSPGQSTAGEGEPSSE